MTAEQRLEETWRWYGPKDSVSLLDVKQAGATGIVTALHDIPTGEVWPVEAILARKAEIESLGMRWSVVESVPVHESIKQMAPGCERFIANYQQTVRNLGRCGIGKLCYNFMPVIDWTRTDLERDWFDGSKALAFDLDDFAAFDLHVLQRPAAKTAYSAERVRSATERFSKMSAADARALQTAIVAGLPGRMVEAYSLDDFREALAKYDNIDAAGLRDNLHKFLREVIPVAAEAGVLMAIHPDDPPMPLLGLPRVVSTEADVAGLLGAVDDVHNGITFCVGSYGSHPENDVEGMARRFAKRTHFVHLRNVRKDDKDGSFTEADHLTGDVDMFDVMTTFLDERRRRCAEGWSDAMLPFRPDHGHQMLGDLDATKKANPGYTAIGRLRGLAELRGLQEGIVRYKAKADGASSRKRPLQ